jgi:HlyD family secretion protein
MRSLVRRLLLAAGLVVVVGALIYGLTPPPVEVDLASAAYGALRVAVDQDGKTRIRERYAVSAPLAGRLLRIELDPGDPIVAGQTVLAVIEPRDPDLLDARAVLQAEAAVRAAEAKLNRMTPLLEEALAGQEQAESDLTRVRAAIAEEPGSVAAAELEEKVYAYRARSALVRSARHAEDIARFELEQAQAALLRSRPLPSDDGASGGVAERPGGQHLVIRAPIDGRVLRVFQESSAVVTIGANLLEVGDPLDLEVEVDVLSRDAVRIRPGAAVLLEHWGGARALRGRVRLVEPSAFTKVSTLGVEEQRVNVIVDIDDPPEERAALGDGFRVEARIVVAEADRALKIPTSALFRAGDDWATFVVRAGVARRQLVEVGLQNGVESEIVAGLDAGERVVVHPGDRVDDGVRVVER